MLSLVLTSNLPVLCSKARRPLPDVVATTTASSNSSNNNNNHKQQQHSKHKSRDFEELAAENERLKAIFQLHSIRYSDSSRSRRNSDPDKKCVTDLLPCDSTKRSSVSSESSSAKCEDVKAKVSPYPGHSADNNPL